MYHARASLSMLRVVSTPPQYFSVHNMFKRRPIVAFLIWFHIIGPCRKVDIVRIASHSALMAMRQTRVFHAPQHLTIAFEQQLSVSCGTCLEAWLAISRNMWQSRYTLIRYKFLDNLHAICQPQARSWNVTVCPTHHLSS